MKKIYLPLLTVVMILAIACGGGGGGGGGNGGTNATSGTDGGTLSSIRVEAVLANNTSQIIDPTNIQVGEQVQFQVVGYTPQRVRTVIASSNWTTNDTTHSIGNLSSSGAFTATHVGGSFTITGRANGVNYSTIYRVKPVQALVTGTVIDSNAFPASRVVLILYNAAGTEVGRVTTASNGTFRASVPTTAVRFGIDKASLPTDFYFRSYVYQSLRYTALETTCTAPLPTLTNGTTTALIGSVVIDAKMSGGTTNPPPPPPTGCPAP